MQETIRHVLSGFAPPVLFAYLIGSYGSQDEGPLSDVDIAIYLDLDSTADGLSLKLSLYAELSKALRRDDIDVVLLNTCDNAMLLYSILTEGSLIHDSAPEDRMLFEQRTLHAAIDFKQQREAIFG